MEKQIVKSYVKGVRISPFKLRRVVNLIRGKNGLDVLDQLKFMPHKAARIVEKALHSALSNAEHNYDMDLENIVIVKAEVDGGKMLRRVRPRAQGRAYIIRKRTSHLTIGVALKD